MQISKHSLDSTLLKFWLYMRQTWSCSLFEGETFFCTGLENPKDSYVSFWLALLHSLSYFFFLWSPSLSLWTVFDSVSSSIDEVLSISPSTNAFVFGDFIVHLKDWLTYSSRTNRPGELCYSFCISNDFNQMVNFPTRIPDRDGDSPAFFYFFHWQILIMLSQFPVTFPQTQIGCPFSSYSMQRFSCWLGWSLWSFERWFLGRYL